MYKKLVDMHVHTDNSPDGHHSAMFICEKAELMGVRALAFTDHCEIDVFQKESYDKRVRQSFFEISKAQSAFRGKVLVLKGIELAQGHYDKHLSDTVLSRYDYDVVLGSVHALRKMTDFCHIESYKDEQTVREYASKYLREIFNLVKWGNFDILAHLTYPFRYFWQTGGIDLDLHEFDGQVDEILTLLAEKEKALEINTAGLRMPIGKLSPEADVVKRFRELGGKYVTFGSDAHYADDITAGLEIAYDTMKQAGFDSFTLYQKRTPILMPIE